MEFTAKQIIVDFPAYERVRQSGAYNMFDPRAQRLSGLTKDEYLFVLKNYDALRELSEQEDK